MPFLLSQLVVKRVLYTMAVVNIALLLLGVSGYLVQVPSTGAHRTAPAWTLPKSSAPASAPGYEPVSRIVLGGSVSGEPNGRRSVPGWFAEAWSPDPDHVSTGNDSELTNAPIILEASVGQPTAALGRLQHRLINDLGGQNQNPSTPAYAQLAQAHAGVQ